MANGALTTWRKSAACGANEIGCGTPTTKAATRKAMINSTLRTVETSWNVPECLIPNSWTTDTSQTTPIPSASGGTATSDLPYSPNAIAASATGAAKPTVDDTHPARKPN